MRSLASLLLACLVSAGASASATDAFTLPPIGSVTLEPGPLLDAFETNRRYVRSFEPDRLLWTFRRQAGLPTPGTPLGGWESPDVELRGHSIGHYLAACAAILGHVDDPEIRADMKAVVEGLAACQAAIGTGWISAFPEEFLDRVEAGRPVWAPYYTLHKILAGLLAVQASGAMGQGNTLALDVARRFADRLAERCATLDDAAMQRMLANEFGGMQEALLDLFAATGDARYRDLAMRFEKRAFLDPLSQGADPLAGLHANTHLAQIEGQARAYELLTSESHRERVEQSWRLVHEGRTYATGGSNSGEYWGPSGMLASSLSKTNQEFCTSFNWARITSSLLRWSGDVRYANDLERVFYNGILVSQHPETGMLIYYLPLATGHAKEHGSPFDTMTCCYGTGIEAYAQLADGAYAMTPDAIAVVQYLSTTLRAKHEALGNVEIRQRSAMPERGATELTFAAIERPGVATLLLRRPPWASDFTVSVNGQPVTPTDAPGGWLAVRRAWAAGDRVELAMPYAMRVVPMPDDPNLAAITVGPLTLAGLVGEDAALEAESDTDRPEPPFVGDKLAPATWIEADGPLRWRTRGMPVDRTLIPIHRVVQERYGVYFPFGSPGGARQTAYEAAKAADAARAARTIDRVAIGDGRSEAEHALESAASASGEAHGRHWRHATTGGHFSYALRVDPAAQTLVRVVYWGDDRGARVFDITVDGTRIATEKLSGTGGTRFVSAEYPIPQALTAGKSSVRVRFEPAPNGDTAGGIFGLSTLRAPTPDSTHANP
ncbi:MAG: glycoside hydrolase family 127 protein [Phycisphaerae bacterium]|nr:glycoside hydrolase family 127 protein [Phycisphaerae bacterium]